MKAAGGGISTGGLAAPSGQKLAGVAGSLNPSGGDDEVAALVRSLGDEGLAAVVAVVKTDLRDLVRVKIRGVVVGA